MVLATPTGAGPRRPESRIAGRRLIATAAALEAVLVLGLLLPLRMDVHPPSLHVNLAGVYGADPLGLALYLLLVGGLMVPYVLAVRWARTLTRAAVPPILAATAIFGVTLLPAHPSYSSDVFHYAATARVAFAHGENPHVTAPEQIADDPLMALSGWKWLPSPYGPAWTWLSGLPYAASAGVDDATRAVLAFKGMAVLGLVVATAGVAVAAERVRPGTGAAAAVLFGWNPLILIHLAADGHNDAAMLALLAWGVAALAFRRPGTALALFGIACLIKAAAVVAVAVLAAALVASGRWRPLAAGLSVTAILGVLLLAPYWAGLETFRAMLDEGRYFTNTPASLVQRLLEPAIGGDPARVLVGGVARAALLILVITAARWSRARPMATIEALAGVYIVAVAVLGTWYQPWYATWPLLFLAVVAPNRPHWFAMAVGLTIGGLLVPAVVNFTADITGVGARAAMIDTLAVAAVLTPLALAWALTTGAIARRREASAMGAPAVE
jgi:hypothetical protein